MKIKIKKNLGIYLLETIITARKEDNPDGIEQNEETGYHYKCTIVLTDEEYQELQDIYEEITNG